MYKIAEVEINGFWHRFDAACLFNNDVNVIIGKNGTGKTTFINIINAVLTVDINGLLENQFDSAKIKLRGNNKVKTIKVQKIEGDDGSSAHLEYVISKSKYSMRIASIDDRQYPISMRRRVYEHTSKIRNELNSLVSISSLSVYRMRNDSDEELRGNRGSKILSPVDQRLDQALQNLTKYQLDLAEEAQKVSIQLQKEVLASILYSEEDANENYKIQLEFEQERERQSLIGAYTQLGVMDTSIRKKIKFHVSAIEKTLYEIRNGKSENIKPIDVEPLEAWRKSKKIIDFSLSAQKKTKQIYSQIELFIEILKEFITDKTIEFSSGKLIILGKYGEISYQKLSSGEKQLIILMVEALLQQKSDHVFLTDEPELSLHISWQRNIIPAVKRINPNSQVVVATHSPEVASKYKDSIFDMEQLIHE
ncbi:AAA family ATPase [Carnimonas nigrificans]|uniref:AAA family ATPase n=1 Tax=Carnimonas nigrificans TaxID=64323 RepID=UPI000471C5B3|nr:AAA family ATPase [Carnimonas nigrificans]